MKIIELTEVYFGEVIGTVLVNPKIICWVKGRQTYSVVVISLDGEDYFTVSETPEEIVKLLEEC